MLMLVEKDTTRRPIGENGESGENEENEENEENGEWRMREKERRKEEKLNSDEFTRRERRN